MQVEQLPGNYKLEAIETNIADNFPKKIDKSIKRIVEKEGFIKYNIFKRCISTNGGNYLGELYEIDVKGKTTAGDKELNIFVKNIIHEESFKVVNIPDVYRTEIFVYKELSKIFEELQEEANVPLEERYKMVKSYESTTEDMVIMENLSKKGFKTYHRMDIPSLEFLEMCFINIARFHGLSFVLKERRPEYFNRKLKTLKYPIVFGDDLKQFLQKFCNITLSVIDEHLKEKVKYLYKTLHDKLAQYLNDETIKSCLCHGDYRPNNILMKEQEGVLQEVIPVDYQVIYYGSPVFDLLYLIYFCTDRDFRKDHISNLKDLYYDTLKNFLKYFNINADTVYPRKDFEKVFKEKMDYGLLIALQMLPFIFVCEEDAADMLIRSDGSAKVDSKMKDRIQGVIEEFMELGYI